MSSQNFVEKWKKSFQSDEAKKRLPSALLFWGPQGSGKRAAAQAVAESLLGPCENHADLIVLTPEKNTIKIEAVRQLISRVNLKPFQASHVVVIIEDADCLTVGAANALLKTLEEPPDFCLFLLLTTLPEQLPTTIRSRCQRIAFQIGTETLRTNLSETYSSWRDDLGPLFRTTRQPFTTATRLAETIAGQPERFDSLFEILKTLWRDAAVYQQTGQTDRLLIADTIQEMEMLAQKKSAERLFQNLDLIGETEQALDSHVHKTLALERLFMELLG